MVYVESRDKAVFAPDQAAFALEHCPHGSNGQIWRKGHRRNRRIWSDSAVVIALRCAIGFVSCWAVTCGESPYVQVVSGVVEPAHDRKQTIVSGGCGCVVEVVGVAVLPVAKVNPGGRVLIDKEGLLWKGDVVLVDWTEDVVPGRRRDRMCVGAYCQQGRKKPLVERVPSG